MTEPNDLSIARVARLLEARSDLTSALTSREKKARSVARLMRVQALYQMELSGIGVESVIKEFSDFRLDGHLDAEEGQVNVGEADADFFAEGLRGVIDQQGVIDRLISDRLAQGWRMERLDATLRALLRSGAWELKFRPDIGTEIILDEYVEMAKAFFDEADSRFVNGALDGVSRDARPRD